MASRSSEELKHKGMCGCAAQRKQRIREINWGSCKKNLFILPDLNILVKEGFYRGGDGLANTARARNPLLFLWLWAELDQLALGDQGCTG